MSKACKIAIAVLLVLVAVMGVWIFEQRKGYLKVKAERERLKGELEEVSVSYQRLKDRADQLNDLLDEQSEVIAELIEKTKGQKFACSLCRKHCKAPLTIKLPEGLGEVKVDNALARKPKASFSISTDTLLQPYLTELEKCQRGLEDCLKLTKRASGERFLTPNAFEVSLGYALDGLRATASYLPLQLGSKRLQVSVGAGIIAESLATPDYSLNAWVFIRVSTY